MLRLLQGGAGAPRQAPPGDAIERAIALMRCSVREPLTVAALARRVGMSRPVFARRFVEQVGVSPGRYLTALRIARAAELLQGSGSLAEVAVQVGYTSEFAFNRAFKRLTGLAPGTFRRRHDAPVPVLMAA